MCTGSESFALEGGEAYGVDRRPQSRYIEESLMDELYFAEVARQAACSQFQLQRMFPYLCGVTLSDYIRRRRMSCAALNPASHRGASS